jgi:hypothetical protein
LELRSDSCRLVPRKVVNRAVVHFDFEFVVPSRYPMAAFVSEADFVFDDEEWHQSKKADDVRSERDDWECDKSHAGTFSKH